MNISSHTCESKPSSITQRGKQLCGCLVPFARQFQGLKREFRRQNLAWTKHFPYTYSLMLCYPRVLNDRQMPSCTVCLSGWKWDPRPQNRLLSRAETPASACEETATCVRVWGHAMLLSVKASVVDLQYYTFLKLGIYKA